jgi:hypothetical protein
MLDTRESRLRTGLAATAAPRNPLAVMVTSIPYRQSPVGAKARTKERTGTPARSRMPMRENAPPTKPERTSAATPAHDFPTPALARMMRGSGKVSTKNAPELSRKR